MRDKSEAGVQGDFPAVWAVGPERELTGRRGQTRGAGAAEAGEMKMSGRWASRRGWGSATEACKG